MNARSEYLILGAGIAGLTAADELTAAGRTAVCLEAQSEAGGLARNIVFRDHIFDIGGHRFFTDKDYLNAWLKELLGDELLEVERRSRILMNGRFIAYPLKAFDALRGLGIGKSISVLAGYLRAAARSEGAQDNFETWVVRRFGRPLYNLYFGPYTQKAWGVAPERISAGWAEQRIQLPSLTQAVSKAIFRHGKMPKTYASKFFYPRLGIGRIAKRLAERIEARGGIIKTSHAVTRLESLAGGGFRATAGEAIFEADRVISTLPVTHLSAILGEGEGDAELTYRCVRCVFLVVDRPRVTDDTWIYVPTPDVLFGRIHEPKNWSRGLVPGDGTSLCLEIFCREGDELWNMPGDQLHRRCVDDLARLGLVRSKEVKGVSDVRVKDAYPVFLVGYENALGRLKARLLARPGLHLLGRTGSFAYANIDQVVDEALHLTKMLKSKV